LAAGLGEITYSMHGHTAQLHDHLTQPPRARFGASPRPSPASVRDGRPVVNVDVVHQQAERGRARQAGGALHPARRHRVRPAARHPAGGRLRQPRRPLLRPHRAPPHAAQGVPAQPPPALRGVDQPLPGALPRGPGRSHPGPAQDAGRDQRASPPGAPLPGHRGEAGLPRPRALPTLLHRAAVQHGGRGGAAPDRSLLGRVVGGHGAHHARRVALRLHTARGGGGECGCRRDSASARTSACMCGPTAKSRWPTGKPWAW
jgi:hypothetical protein